MSEEKRQIKKERVGKNKETQNVHHIYGCHCVCAPMCGKEREKLRKQWYDKLFEFIEKEYPKNADEKFEIVLDNGGWTTVSARAFMSIRQFCMKELEANRIQTLPTIEEETDEEFEEKDEVM